MSSDRNEASKVFTLHDVATAGLSKAVRAKRPRSEFVAVPGLPAPKRQAAPVCGGQAAVLDEEREVDGGKEPHSVSGDECAAAADAVADVNAADWIAEEDEIAGDDNFEFEWEDDNYDDENDGTGVSISVEVGGNAEEPDVDETKRRKRQALAAQRKLQQIQHRASTICSLARGLVMDRAADCKAVQASILSIADPSLQADVQKQPNAQVLEKVVAWTKTTFCLCEPDDLKWGSHEEDCLADVQEMELASGADYCAPAAQRAAAQLLGCIHRCEATEEQIAALLVAFLRGAGAMTRLVNALQVIPLWRVRNAATSSAPGPSQPPAATAKWKGRAHVVIASPIPTSAGPHKFKRKSKSKQAPTAKGSAGGTPAPPTESDPSKPASASPRAADPNHRQRRGDEEFERQLQMALLATKDGNSGVDGVATQPGKPDGPAGLSTPHLPGSSTMAAQRPASLFWAEVFCGASSDGAWVHADGFAGVVDAPGVVEAGGRAKPTIGYVAAFLGGSVKDVTRRYAASYVKTLRARDEKWFVDVMKPLRGTVSPPQAQNGSASAPRQPAACAPGHGTLPADTPGARSGGGSGSRALDAAVLAERREDAELAQQEVKERQSLPKTIEGFKRHPLYVLQRHISKYQGLAPGAAQLGVHRGEPYYDRSALSELHAAGRWKRLGFEVLPGEMGQPAKVITHTKAKGGAKGRGGGRTAAKEAPPADAGEQAAEEVEEGKKVDLYGPWQTRPWAPPAACDGIVPRNERGNVEAPPFAAVLPAGTVHIDLPRAAAAAAQLEVDAAPALIGFEPGRQGGMVPKIRGVVVCTEHADAVREVAQASEDARLEKLRQKRIARGKDAWVSVLLTVHERLQLQRVVDAEQLRGRRGAQHVACESTGGDAACEGSQGKEGCAGEAAGGSKRRKARGGASKGGGRGKGKQTRADTMMADDGDGGRPKRKSAGRSMGSRLRDQLHALTGEPQ